MYYPICLPTLPMQRLHTKFTFGKEKHVDLYEKLNRDNYRVFDLYPLVATLAFLILLASTTITIITFTAIGVTRGYTATSLETRLISSAVMLILCLYIGLLTHWLKDRLYCYPNGIMITRNNGVVRRIELNTDEDKPKWKLNASFLPFLTCLHLDIYSGGDPYIIRHRDSNEIVSCLYQSLNENATNTVSFDI